MCIVFFEWTEDRFLVCHNRDEVFRRPTRSMHWWPPTSGSTNDVDTDAENNVSYEMLAPRDAVSGGTWFGFEKKTGRCAFLTNVRELDSTKYASSRGALIVNYLTSDCQLSALEYLQKEFGTAAQSTSYAAFSLVVFSGHDLAYFSNRYPEEQLGPISLSMGTAYGLSNSVLQEPYAKVRKGLTIFEQVLTNTRKVDGDDADLMDALEALMQRDEYCPGDPLPKTGEPGFPEATVKHRSSICIPIANGYGTRTTIRFLLQTLAGDEEGNKDNNPKAGIADQTKQRRQNPRKEKKWRLRCIEKNWNAKTLEWEPEMDLSATLTLKL